MFDGYFYENYNYFMLIVFFIERFIKILLVLNVIKLCSNKYGFVILMFCVVVNGYYLVKEIDYCLKICC